MLQWSSFKYTNTDKIKLTKMNERIHIKYWDYALNYNLTKMISLLIYHCLVMIISCNINTINITNIVITAIKIPITITIIIDAEADIKSSIILFKYGHNFKARGLPLLFINRRKCSVRQEKKLSPFKLSRVWCYWT